MSQIMRILRKDAQHHWIEILLCQAALFVFVANEVHGWKFHEIYGLGRFWPVAVDGLLPVSWWILIVRAVQGDGLVGDRQFWITRPYEWKKLVTAKILFVLVFINIPLMEVSFSCCGKSRVRPNALLSRALVDATVAHSNSSTTDYCPGSGNPEHCSGGPCSAGSRSVRGGNDRFGFRHFKIRYELHGCQ